MSEATKKNRTKRSKGNNRKQRRKKQRSRGQRQHEDRPKAYRVRSSEPCGRCGNPVARNGDRLAVSRELESGERAWVCLPCGGFDGWEFLPRGDRTRTIRATKASRAAEQEPLVVMQWMAGQSDHYPEGLLVPAWVVRLADEGAFDE